MRDLAEVTLELCSIASVTGDEAAIATHVLDRVGAAVGTPSGPCGSSAGAWRLGNNVVAWGPRRGGSPLVGLFGHLDTVPAHREGAPRREGDRIRGLGASDMKGGLALMLRALSEVDLYALPVDLVAVFYDREEGPFAASGLRRVLDQVTDLARVDLGVCLEPTANRVQVGCLGSLHATLVFRGVRAHSARPWLGANAIHGAAPVLTALANREPQRVERGGLVFVETMQATLAEGGSARNVVPDELRVNVNVRFAPGRTAAGAEEDLRVLVADRAEIEVTDRAPAGPVPLANPLLDRLVAASGRDSEAKQAWTDVARLAMHGIDAVCFGPGEPAQAHQAGEYVPVANLERGWEILLGFLRGRGTGARG